MSEAKLSPVKRFFRYVALLLLILILYFTRSIWPLVFVGEPIATIHATIPPDKQLHIGMGLESFSCKFMTASSGSLINARRTWTKQYSPDAEGKVTVNVYPKSLSFCDWEMTGFSVAVKNENIPQYVYHIPFVPQDVRDEVKQEYANYEFNQSYAIVTFKKNRKFSTEHDSENFISVEDKIYPYFTKARNRFGDYIYRFDYGATRLFGESEYNFDLTEKLTVEYVVREDKKAVKYVEEDYVDRKRFETTVDGGRKELRF